MCIDIIYCLVPFDTTHVVLSVFHNPLKFSPSLQGKGEFHYYVLTNLAVRIFRQLYFSLWNAGTRLTCLHSFSTVRPTSLKKSLLGDVSYSCPVFILTTCVYNSCDSTPVKLRTLGTSLRPPFMVFCRNPVSSFLWSWVPDLCGSPGVRRVPFCF